MIRERSGLKMLQLTDGRLMLAFNTEHTGQTLILESWQANALLDFLLVLKEKENETINLGELR